MKLPMTLISYCYTPAGGGPLIIADLIIDYTYSLIKLVLLDDRLQFHVCLLYFRYTAHLLVPWY